MTNINELCMHCMNPLPAHQTRCELCGHTTAEQNEPLYLRVRTILCERYAVGLLVSAGGDSAIYAGYDLVANAPCEIRELLPDTLCERAADGSVAVISGCENAFEEYKESFRIHARALARMRDVAVVIPTYDIFEENNTVYTVSEKVSGVSLESHLAISGGKLSWEDARPLFIPLFNAFVTLHAAGMRHYGVSPENLLVGSDGKLHVRGFSLPDARQVGSDLKPQLCQGYAAPEQYGFNQHCDTATDVYGLTATLFRALTGNPPPDGAGRKGSDLFVPTDVAKTLPEYVKLALFKGLQVPFDKRLQTVEELRDILSATPAVAELRRDGDGEVFEEEEEEDEKPSGNRKIILLVSVGAFVLLLLIAGLVLFLLFGNDQGDQGGTTVPSSSTSMTTTTQTDADPNKKYVVDNLVGSNYFQILDDPRNGAMTLQLETMQFSNAPRGQILSQSPVAGEQLTKGAVIKVVISAGAREISVPDVAGWKADQAKLYLEALGFTVKEEIIYMNVSAYEKGLVDSTLPAVGAKLPYGAAISLRVSNMETTTTTTTTTTAEPTDSTTPPDEDPNATEPIEPTDPSEDEGGLFDDLFGDWF